MKRCLILVEGQTEEQFVKRVLQRHLANYGVWATPTVVTTKRVKSGRDFKGGLISYGQVRNDLRRLLRDQDATCISTLFDYYGLPEDFPGMATRHAAVHPIAKVEHVESAFAEDVRDPRFQPYLMLHEFEALIFSDLDACRPVFPQGIDLNPLVSVRTAFRTPEDINEGDETAPSKRILRCHAAYQKPIDGPIAVEAIGLSRLRSECRHFNAWLSAMEEL